MQSIAGFFIGPFYPDRHHNARRKPLYFQGFAPYSNVRINRCNQLAYSQSGGGDDRHKQSDGLQVGALVPAG